MADERELLREASRRILDMDRGLADQVDKLRGLSQHPELKPTLEGMQRQVGALESLGSDSALSLETIVNRVGRPVLEVAADDYVVEGPEAAIWEARLGNAAVRAALRRVIPSVGRIEVDNHPDLTWVGTGWLIADDVVVTNRHVASEFAALSNTSTGRSFVFKRGWPDRETRMASRVDFRRELRNNSPRAFSVREVLHIEDDDGPDFAFLRVEQSSAAGKISPPLIAAKASALAKQFIATIGYPASDSRLPEQDLMTRLFGDKYNVKRLAPGQVMRLADELVMHDCSTLGGNSGSPIIDLATGEVLGLHFSGLFLRENRGVPIDYVMNRLKKIGKVTAAPEQTGLAVSTVPVPVAQTASVPLATTPVTRDGSISFTVPLQISISIGSPAMSMSTTVVNSAPPAVPASANQVHESISAAVKQTKQLLASRTEILNVRDGYVFRDGWITSDPAIIVVLQSGATASAQELKLPSRIGDIPIEVRAADPWDVAAAAGLLETLEGVPRTSYKKPDNFELKEVNEKMVITVHVSPDAGWPMLRDFLEKTEERLTIGMYDFTAPHIVDGVLNAVEDDPRELTLVMQQGEALTGKPDDIPEEETLSKYKRKLRERLDYAPASVGKDRQFASAYHIKVAVRDGKSFWLSSGNWQSSNQPNHEIAVGETTWNLLLEHNREWHVVIENKNLAKQFAKYIEFDLENAKSDAANESPAIPEAFFVVDEAVQERVPSGTPTYFAPLKINRKVRVQPLLTPDNYQEHVLSLIQSAERRLLFQNQSLSVLGLDGNGEDKNDERFTALVDALLERHQAGVDVRIIIRGEFAPVGPLEQLQKRGFDMSKVKLQNRCHTKGIVVDSARVLVGSHNWTNQGTLVNRDASLIFHDDEIAKYFEEIFWFDWKNLTRQSVSTRRTHSATSNESLQSGLRRVSWQEIVNGD